MNAPAFKEVTKKKFKEIYFRLGGGDSSGWTADYWRKFFDDEVKPGWRFMVEEPRSSAHDRMWIVTDHETKEYRLFFMTEQSTENFFDHRVEQGAHSRKVKPSLSDLKSERPPGGVLYSEKLLGLRSECPACSEWEDSTGWLLCHEGDTSRWYVEFKCRGCRSRGPEWKLKLTPLIEEVLKDEWNRLMAAPSKPCTECGGGGKCDACGGTGVEVLAGLPLDCERCGGAGACFACGGSGKVE